MLTLRQFQQFLAVAEAMSFRRAADRLNMAQPPLTAAIRQMEQEIGSLLFERSNRITKMTAAGEVLAEEARRAIAQAERAVMLARRAGAGLAGALRIGFVATAVRHILPRLIANFRESHPEVSLDLVEAPTARSVAALAEDRLDLAILALPLASNAASSLAIRRVLESELVAALPARHALASADAPISLGALSEEPWILFPAHEGPGLHEAIWRACATAGFEPHVVQRAVQMETIVGLVAAGLGVALVPKFFEEAGWNGVAFHRLAGAGTPIRYDVALAWRRADRSPALAAFLNHVHSAETTTGANVSRETCYL